MILFCYILISLFLLCSAQSCNNYVFASDKVFSTCNDLPYLNSFLHWTYDPSSGTAQIAFRHTGIASPRWVAWAINPEGKGMVGSQALVAFQKSDGTMSVYTSPVTGYQTQLQKGDLSFGVSDLSATYSNNEIVVFATLELPKNTTTVNQVWQDGPVLNDSPGTHDLSGANVRSMATLNLLSGQQSGTKGTANSKIRSKYIHGVLNAISWGIMMPLGVVIARYVSVQISRPCMVLPSCHLPNLCLHRRCCRMGNRSPTQKEISRHPTHCPQDHWHSSLLPRNASGAFFASKA